MTESCSGSVETSVIARGIGNLLAARASKLSVEDLDHNGGKMYIDHNGGKVYIATAARNAGIELCCCK